MDWNGHIWRHTLQSWVRYEPRLVSCGVQLVGKEKACNKIAQNAQQLNFSTWNSHLVQTNTPRYTAVYSKYTAVYSGVYGRILRYWSLKYTAVYPKSPKWDIFKHNIDHHNRQTRGISQPTYACIVHCTFVAPCTCHIPLSPKTPLFHPHTARYSWYARYVHHMHCDEASLFVETWKGAAEGEGFCE